MTPASDEQTDVTPASMELPAIPDPFSILSFVAACTTSVKLGMSVLVLPMRNPVITAHGLATLDVLSEGRCIAGVGVGWNREEFETLGAPFERRGARTDDYLEVMRHLWCGSDTTFTGDQYSIGDVTFGPRPIQQPHPPLWIGGNEEPALRRTVRFGRAWHFVFLGADEVRVRVERLRQLATAAGRDPSSIEITGLRPDIMAMNSDDARREVQALVDVGVSHLIVGLPMGNDSFGEELERFSHDVIEEFSPPPAVGRAETSRKGDSR